MIAKELYNLCQVLYVNFRAFTVFPKPVNHLCIPLSKTSMTQSSFEKVKAKSFNYNSMYHLVEYSTHTASLIQELDALIEQAQGTHKLYFMRLPRFWNNKF